MSREVTTAAELFAAMESKPVLTVREAAAYAGISVGTLYRRWREDNGPISFKVGRTRRVRKDALLAWVKASEKQAMK